MEQNTDKEEKFNLPRDEMAIRAPYWNFVESEELKTVFRPGDRRCGTFRSYCPDEKITLRLLNKIGADWAKVPPVFDENKKKSVIIKTVEVIPIEKINKDHFKGSSPDIHDLESLLFHIALVYNLDIGEIKEVTRTTFDYIS